jgi:WD40 repeat protein
MSSLSSQTNRLPPESGHHIDRICDQFEASWKAGTRPRLEIYLAGADESIRAELLTELLALELIYRRAAGEQPELEEYRSRFPEDDSALAGAFAVGSTFQASGSPGNLVDQHPTVDAPGENGPTADYPDAPFAGPAVEFAPGSLLGDYELLDLIGHGGMGWVYRARQRSVGRIVALKLVRLDNAPPGGQEQWLARFRREAWAAARLEHDHIVPLYEMRESGGQHFFSMRYVDGESLAQMLHRGPLPPARAAAYLEVVARAVHYAHGRGILHRDLKPGNILVDREDRPFVADFGLARWQEAPQHMTQSGACLGSPPYMPPEQIRNSSSITVASDIYSLGATLYNLLAGRPPFHAATSAETFEKVLHDEPVPLRQLSPTIPRDLETITLKCLDKEPRRRYASAAELADDLRRFLDGRPIKARPVGRPERLWRWCRRNPGVAGLSAAVALLALALMSAGVFVAWERRRGDIQIGRESESNRRDDLLHQAQIYRQGSRAGRRWLALAALQQAAAIQPGSDLRDEYLRCLELADLRPLRDVTVPQDAGSGVHPLARFEKGVPPGLYLLAEAAGGATPQRLRILSDNGPVEIDLEGNSARGYVSGIGPMKRPAVLSPDGRFLIAAKADRPETDLWDLTAGGPANRLTDRSGRRFAPHCAAFSDQSNLLAVAYESNEPAPVWGRHYLIVFYDLWNDCKHVAEWPLEAEGLDCLRFNPAGDLLAAGTSTQREVPVAHYAVRLWSVPDGKNQGILPLEPWGGGREDFVAPQRIAFSKDGQFLAAAKSMAKVWKISAAGSDRALELREFKLRRPGADRVQFLSADSRWLGTADESGRVQLWDLVTSQAVGQGRQDEPLHAESAGPPAAVVVTSAGSPSPSSLRLWEMARPLGRTFALSPQPAQRLAESRMPVLAFSREERWLAYGLDTGAAPPLLDLHHLDTTPFHLPVGEGSPGTPLFSPEGDRLWIASRSRQQNWDLSAAPPARREARQFGLVAAALDKRGERITATLEEHAGLKLIDLVTGQENDLFRDIAASTQHLSPPQFGPNGDLILGLRTWGSGAVKAKVWNTETGALLHESDAGAGRIFLQGDRPLVLSSAEELAVRELPFDRQPPQPQPGPSAAYPENGSLEKYALSDDGRLCAESGLHGEIAIWDLSRAMPSVRATITRSARQPGSRYGQDLKAFSRDGSMIAAFDGRAVLAVWDTKTGKELGRLELSRRPELFAFDAGDRRLLLVYLGQRADVWRPGEHEASLLCALPSDPALERERKEGSWQFDYLPLEDALCITRDRRQVLFVSRTDSQGLQTIYNWNLPDGGLTTRRVAGVGSDWPRVAVRPDGRKLAVLDMARVAALTSPDRKHTHLSRVVRAPEDMGASLNRLPGQIRFSPDGDYAGFLERQGESQRIHVVQVSSASEFCAATLPAPASNLALARAARRAAVACGKSIIVLDPRTGQTVGTIGGHDADVRTLALDAEGELLASASVEEGVVRLWRVATGEALATFSLGGDGASHVALSPTGRWLAAVDARGQLRLWNLFEARAQLRLAGLDW